jgi:hypothetical protein
MELYPAIKPYSVWRHTNGGEYVVIGFTNSETTQPEKYPAMVVYASMANKNIWSRRIIDWHRSMTFVRQVTPSRVGLDPLNPMLGIVTDVIKETGLTVGMTGTREGMSKEQKKEVKKILTDLKATKFHHGDCVGADAEAHAIAKKLGLFVTIHPPKEDALRAWCDGDIILRKYPYMKRNHNIVDGCDYLIATPATCIEEKRSGTWATIRYAIHVKKPLIVIYPDGTHLYQAGI